MARGLLGPALVMTAGAASAATVVAVEEGDRLRVRDGGGVRSVRLACLDAPELGQHPHGASARASLQRLLPVGTAIRLVTLANAGESIAVAEVYTASGNVNLEMVRQGQAFAHHTPQPQCDPLRYASAERSAQFQRLGVWVLEGGAQRPWDWRASRPAQPPARRRPSPLAPAGATMSLSGGGRAAPSPSPVHSTRRPAADPDGVLACASEFQRQFQRNFPGRNPPRQLFQDTCACMSTTDWRSGTILELVEGCMNRALERQARRTP